MDKHLKRGISAVDLLFLFLIITQISCFIWIFPESWFGFLIVITTYYIPLLIKPLNNNNKILLSTYIGITIHHFVAFRNGFFAPTFGADKDASGFFEDASSLAKYADQLDFSIGSDFFKSFLAIIFRYLGDSKFLGSELSVLFFVLSLIFLCKIVVLIKKENYLFHVVLLFSCLPTNFLFTSVTLRESYQTFFFILASYLALQLIERKSLTKLIQLLAPLLLFGALHNGLVSFIPIFLIVSLFYSLDGKKIKFSRGVKFILFLLCLVITVSSFFALTKAGFSSKASESVVSGEVFDYSQEYRDVENSGGSSYGAQFNSVFSLPILFINYMFAPFPWQIRNSLDLYAAFESLLRFLLIYYAFKGIRKKKKNKEDTKALAFLFLISLSLELVWSMGTLNWGTAMRHHLIAYGILLVLGIEGLTNSFRRRLYKIYN
ncbi:hypothetical protein V2I71_18400 [Peribacillus frigoritolerans]|uniref:hypothetical protein n=1 Tax=Peribacillus frigoritolerans TaxID=450367 RepID=UPI002ED51456|nr:hypothetical protein V2I71_18400 [Peribacillus frigoritolerans]